MNYEIFAMRLNEPSQVGVRNW